MFKRIFSTDVKWSRAKFDRILLFILLPLAAFMRLAHPFPELVHTSQSIITIILVVGIISLLFLSFYKDFFKKNLYYFILAIIGLFGLDILISLDHSSFAETVKTGYLLLILIAPLYMRASRELFLFQLLNTSAIIFLYLINSQLPPNALAFIPTVIGINIFTYFIVGSQIQKTFQLSQKGFYYGRIIERLNDGVLQLDENGTIIMVNQQFCEIMGYEREELVGKMNISAMMSKDNRRVLAKHLQDRKEEKGGTYEMKFTLKDGKEIWLHLSINTQFDQGGNLKGSTAIVSDITQRKHAEKNLIGYSENLRHSNQALEIANSELEQFTQIAATDLKAPLLSMKQAISDIKNACDIGEFEKGASMLSKLKNSSEHMRELLDALWQYAKSSPYKLDYQETDLEKLIHKLIKKKEISNKTNISIKSIPKVFVDSWQIERLLYHLIDNAIKFGGEQEHIQIDIHGQTLPGKEMCKFYIQDNGPGIPKVFHENVFLIFQKGPYQNKQGIGLGLPFCKKIVENHGGKIWLDPTQNNGTRIYFTLPQTKKAVSTPLLS